MANLKGGYVILDLGKLNDDNLPPNENTLITDDFIFSTNYNGKELKKVLKELFKLGKPLLIKYSKEIVNYIISPRIIYTSNAYIIELYSYIVPEENFSISTYETYKLNYDIEDNRLRFEYVLLEQ